MKYALLKRNYKICAFRRKNFLSFRNIIPMELYPAKLNMLLKDGLAKVMHIISRKNFKCCPLYENFTGAV